jgi:hypothetical protein
MYTSWTRNSLADANWYKLYHPGNCNWFATRVPTYNLASPTALTLVGASLQVSAVTISNNGANFVRSSLCTNGGFSLRYSFQLSAAPSTASGLPDGLTVAFTPVAGMQPWDASYSYTNPTNGWKADVANVPVVASTAVNLGIDTRDSACGVGPYPCTSTYTNYDNWRIPRAGTGYRVVSYAGQYNDTIAYTRTDLMCVQLAAFRTLLVRGTSVCSLTRFYSFVCRRVTTGTATATRPSLGALRSQAWP